MALGIGAEVDRLSLVHAVRRAHWLPLCVVLSSVVSHASLASDERVGIGSLTPRAVIELGSSVTVIDREEIERRGVPFASDLLREVPGVAVSRTGSFGSLTQVRIRGAEGNHTLVMIDGVEVTDPALNDEFDFGNLLADDIERIEVLRGSQSALYGSEAVGGVINIVTRELPEGVHAGALVEAGTFGTRRAHAIVGGGGVDWRLTGSINFLDTHGISHSPTGGERDGYRNHTYNLRGSARLAPFFRVGGSVRYSREDHERDTQDFVGPSTFGLIVNTRENSVSEHGTGRAWAEVSLLEGRWTHRVDISKLDTKRDERDDGFLLSETRGDKRRYRYQTTGVFEAGGLSHVVTGAYEHGRLQFVGSLGTEQTQTLRENSWIGEYRVNFDETLFLSGSVRRDNNDDFDNATTYRATLSYVLPWESTRLHASWGEGVKNPGMFDLFGELPNFFGPGFFFRGNPNLKPETSEGWDIGFEQELLNGAATFGLTYFENDLEDEIDGFVSTGGDPAFTADNVIGESERDGFEATLRIVPWTGFDLTATYSYVDSDQTTLSSDKLSVVETQHEIRRPKHTGSVAANLRFLRDRANINLAVLYNGSQLDTDFSTNEEVRLGAYTLVQLTGSYQLSDRIEMFGRIENLLDDDYHEIAGYESPGFGAYAGFRFRY